MSPDLVRIVDQMIVGTKFSLGEKVSVHRKGPRPMVHLPFPVNFKANVKIKCQLDEPLGINNFNKRLGYV